MDLEIEARICFMTGAILFVGLYTNDTAGGRRSRFICASVSFWGRFRDFAELLQSARLGEGADAHRCYLFVFVSAWHTCGLPDGTRCCSYRLSNQRFFFIYAKEKCSSKCSFLFSVAVLISI